MALKTIISKKYYAILLLLGVAGVLRLFYLRFEYAAGWDEINYLKLGASGAIHGWKQVLHPYWSPLYPFFIAFTGKIIPDIELAGRLVSLLFGVLLIVPFYILVEKLFSRKIALHSSLIIALFPMLIESSVSALTESLYIFLAVIGVLIGLLALKKGSVTYAAVTGALFSLSYLTRPEGFGLLIVFASVAVAMLIYQRVHKQGTTLHWVVISTVACFFIIGAPYWYYLHQATGRWTLSSKGTANLHGAITAMEHKNQSLNPWLLLNEDNTHLPDDDIYHTGEFLKNYQPADQQGQSDITSSKGLSTNSFRFFKKYVRDFHEVNTRGVGSVLGLPLLLLGVLGLFGRTGTHDKLWQDVYLLSYVIFFWIILIPVFHVTERYLLPMVPIVLIWSARGIDPLVEWIQSLMTALSDVWNNKLSSLFPVMIVMLLIGSFIAPGLIRMALKNPSAPDQWAEPIEMKKAGLWMRGHCQQPPVIMAWNHAISFYAGNYDIRQTVSIPQNQLDRVLAYARNRGAKYIALNEKNKQDFPTISYLLDETQAPATLKVVYKDDSIHGLKTIIYEIVD